MEAFEAEIAFAKMNLLAAQANEKEAASARKAARKHMYRAWQLTGNVARVARAMGLSRPYVSQMVTKARKEKPNG